MKLLIFSLGIKGVSVVKALADASDVQSIFCVIGQDDGVSDDCSDKLVSYCEQHKIKYAMRHDADIQTHDYDYDFAIAVGWRWIIREIPSAKLIVFHDSLLPRYRGFAPLVNALINKEHITGVTALLGAEEYDRGNILLQKSMNLVYPTSIGSVISRISAIYAELALELVRKLNDGEIHGFGYPQDERSATYSLWRNEDDYRINWDNDAESIEHFISCVGPPYRGASALLNESIVRIFEAQARADVKIENRTAGKVIFLESGLPIVVCGTGLLALMDVRNEHGESVVPLKSFRSMFQ